MERSTTMAYVYPWSPGAVEVGVKDLLCKERTMLKYEIGHAYWWSPADVLGMLTTSSIWFWKIPKWKECSVDLTDVIRPMLIAYVKRRIQCIT